MNFEFFESITRKKRLFKRPNIEFFRCNGRNKRKRGSAQENTLPPQSGTAVFLGRFPLGACFDNYNMHKLDIRPKRIILAVFALAAAIPSFSEGFTSLDMIELRHRNDALYDVYTIGNSSQSYPAERWIEPFEINKYETTYELWRSTKEVAEHIGFVFAHPGRPGSHGKTGSDIDEKTKHQPVTFISWYDAVVWCNALSKIHGLEPCYKYRNRKTKEVEVLTDSTDTAKIDLSYCDWKADGYRLPTEAEWEYAATKIEDGFMGGDLVSGQVMKAGYVYGDEISEDDVSWTLSNTNRTMNVGTAGTGRKDAEPGSGKANYIGAFDMGGNVLEFCWDWFEPRYSAVQGGKRAAGPEYGSDRVCRGGSYSPLTIFSSAGDRYHYDPNEYYDFMGFRVVRSLSN